PGSPAAVPTTETEQPGVGPAVGGVIGAAAGAAGGIQLAAAATSLIPGIGPVVALGALAGALVGLGGGAAIGSALEESLAEGLPKDEWFLYEDALRRGRTLLIVLAEDESQAETVRRILAAAGAEDLDSARQRWWLGLRSAEAEAYTTGGGDFPRDEAAYRRGFEAALRPETRDRAWADIVEYLRRCDPDVASHEAYRRGFERGQAHRRRLAESTRTPYAA
ncbi:MAG TPA: hypothetical protein VGX21_11780, partial [Methylomirabilota bacterium]|nr:hypothetical protein [Methylomirabilota bacterium]